MSETLAIGTKVQAVIVGQVVRVQPYNGVHYPVIELEDGDQVHLYVQEGWKITPYVPTLDELTVGTVIEESDGDRYFVYEEDGKRWLRTMQGGFSPQWTLADIEKPWKVILEGKS